MTPTLSSLKGCYHWKLGNVLLLVKQLMNGEAAAWGSRGWGCLSMLAGQVVWGPEPSPSEIQPKQLDNRDKRASRLWNLQGMFKKPNGIKPRKREKGEIQLWLIRENKHSSDPVEMTVKSKMWAARVVVISNKKNPNCSLVRADQYTKWQCVSQSKCRAVSHPPQRALSLDKSQRDNSRRKKSVGKERDNSRAVCLLTEQRPRGSYAPLLLFLARYTILSMFHKYRGQPPALGNFTCSANKN